MSEQCPVCNNPIEEHDDVCPNCGFKLLGSTESFKPVALSDSEVIPLPDKPLTTAVLRVIRGPQIEMVFSLDTDSSTIGRSPNCEIFLNDMTVSRTHATIDRVGEGYQITDANSFNGVWVNNENIESALLSTGDIIQIGAFCLLYQENPRT